MGISIQTGKTDCGYMAKMMAMIKPKIAITIHSSSRTIRKKIVLVRLFTYFDVISEIDFPWLRRDITSAPKSCTAPMTMVPTSTQIRAGTQPQITPIAGPTMGPVPAMEVK